jgi:hypothetical protein
MFSAHQKKKRLREGGVGPEMRSPAGLVGMILCTPFVSVKARNTTRDRVLG